MENNESIHDVVMVGAGPASLSAAIYTTREEIETVIYEKGVVGGLAATTDWVDNYPGFAKGVEGMKLTDEMRGQAERFGAKIEFGEVSEIKRVGDLIELTVDGNLVQARAVLIATGSDYKKLAVPGEAEYYARGVHYCATCDGAFYKDKRIIAVGGGNSGVQEAMFLTRFASHIDLLVRSELRASEVLQKELRAMSDKITVHTNVLIDEIVGDGENVTGVNITHKLAGEKGKVEADGVFVLIGLSPNTKFLIGSGIELDEVGLIKTDLNLETSIPGVFAAGDVRSGATMQIATAVGEGATAALKMRQYLEKQA